MFLALAFVQTASAQKKSKSVEPLYWVNPLEYSYNELNAPKHMKLPKPVLDDADGDGVTDQFDNEPNTPAGCPVDSHGVSKDTDGDGVADNVDWEINSPAGCKVDSHGVCPKEDNKPVLGGAYNLPTVYFDLDKSVVKKDYMIELQRTALTLFANPTMKLDIVGNTDKHHSDDYNDKLGMRRAKVVADILIQRFNVPVERINVKSNGKHILKSPNDELNRRVDVIPAQ